VPEPAFSRLMIPADVHGALVAQARAEAPLECCGLLAGRVLRNDGIVERRYPLLNEAASTVEFVSDARSMFDAMRDIDRRDLDVLAVYHSHPTTPPLPSKTDLERSYSPAVVNVIISLQKEPPEMRGWWLREDGYLPAAIEILS
jgi:[CysO sulfur-carrier protein]-S-L-cysteine hydrolase